MLYIEMIMDNIYYCSFTGNHEKDEFFCEGKDLLSYDLNLTISICYTCYVLYYDCTIYFINRRGR